MNAACTICHDDLFFGRNREVHTIKSTICGHVYHSQCILQWTTRSKTCPYCRKTLSENNIFKLNFPIDDTHKTKIAEAESRITALKESLDMKDVKLREMRENYTKLDSLREKSRKGLEELQKRMQQLINAEINLHNELTGKNKQLQEIQRKCATEKLANEELRKKITDLEDLIQDLMHGKSEEESELKTNRKKLQEIEAKFIIAERENEELRFEVQSLKAMGNGNIEPRKNHTINLNSDQEMGQTLGKEIDKLITHLRAEQQRSNSTVQTNEKMRVFNVELVTLREEMKKLKTDLASKLDKNNLTTVKEAEPGTSKALEMEARKLETIPNSDQLENSSLTKLTSSDLSAFQITRRSLLLAITVLCLFGLFLLFLYYRRRK